MYIALFVSPPVVSSQIQVACRFRISLAQFPPSNSTFAFLHSSVFQSHQVTADNPAPLIKDVSSKTSHHSALQVRLQVEHQAHCPQSRNIPTYRISHVPIPSPRPSRLFLYLRSEILHHQSPASAPQAPKSLLTYPTVACRGFGPLLSYICHRVRCATGSGDDAML